MKWYSSTEKSYFKEMPVFSGEGRGPVRGADGQTVRGFGCCFSELGQKAVWALDETQRNEVMNNLFSSDEAGFTFGRVAVGANDFALDWYSLDEEKDDYELAHFSLARDRENLFPLIHLAQRYSPALSLFASPWSPPAWMKQPPVYNYGKLKKDARTQDAYARYLVRFLEEYQAEGIPIKALCVQNEVFADQKFPSCLWSGQEMRDFIRDHIGPALTRSKAETSLWLGTLNGPCDYECEKWYQENLSGFVASVLEDEQAAAYVQGIALQWAGKHILEEMKAQYPQYELIQSECECGDGTNRFEAVFYVFNLMWKYFHAGATAFVYWNLALEDDASSTWGWKQNSLVTVNRDAHRYHLNPEYYLMKHLSAFVKPGAVYVPLTGHWAANSLLFRNPDGTEAFIAVNQSKQETVLQWNGAEIILPPRSINTLYGQ